MWPILVGEEGGLCPAGGSGQVLPFLWSLHMGRVTPHSAAAPPCGIILTHLWDSNDVPALRGAWRDGHNILGPVSIADRGKRFGETRLQNKEKLLK